MLLAGMQRPKQKQQLRCGGFQQRREVEVKGAEADAVFAQLPAGILVERLDLGGGCVAAKHAKIFSEPKGESAGEARKVLGLAQSDQRFELRL